MLEEAYMEALQPRHLIDLALRGHWVAICLAILGLLFVVVVASFPVRCSKVVPLVPLAWTMPVYTWAIVGSLGAVLTFDSMAALHGITTLDLWAVALSQSLALFAVLVLVAASAILASRQLNIKANSFIGPIAGVGAVTADWLFLLLVATPMR